tara:strand:+ start:13717 stop:15348 length:1632 start_codon:yes stop_codon:yes gene_type:complete
MSYTRKYLNNLKYSINVHIIERLRLLVIQITRILFYKKLKEDNLNKKKFIFNLQYIWAFSELEFMCASQLKQLGHDVIILICDELPYTEIEIIGQKKPSYKSYFNRAKRYCSAYNLKFITIGSFISEQDKNLCSQISHKEIDYLLNLNVNEINIGEIAKRNHAHFYKGDIYPNGQYKKLFRKIIQSALIIEKSISKIISKYNNYDLITANGKFIQTAIPALVNKNKGNSFYTYEVFGQGNGVILDKNKYSMEQRLDEQWNNLKNIELKEDQLKRLYYSFDLQERSASSDFDLWDENRIDDKSEIQRMLDLDLSKKIISCYPNVYWDSTHMGLDGISKDLTSWLIDMIDFAKTNSDVQLVIRSHPGELNVPKVLQSKHTIVDSIMDQIKQLPNNVKIINPKDNISSYSLSEISNLNLVWNGTIGIELALRGIKPVVVADAYYSKKGFTFDLKNFTDLKLLLENTDYGDKLNLTKDEKSLAEIFAYHIRFNRKFNPPYYFGTRCTLFNYLNTCKGKNSTLDSMVGYFLDKNSYMNIGEFNFDQID